MAAQSVKRQVPRGLRRSLRARTGSRAGTGLRGVLRGIFLSIIGARQRAAVIQRHGPVESFIGTRARRPDADRPG
jgi:hypothetical protein